MAEKIQTGAVVETTTAAAKAADTAPKTAPAGLFQNSDKPVNTANPTRVKLITELVKDYVAKTGTAVSDQDQVATAQRVLYTAVKLLCMLNGSDLTNVSDFLVETISTNKNGSFGMDYVFRFIGGVSPTDRDCTTRVLNLFVQYAGLTNKSKISNFVDVEYAVEKVADPIAKKQLAAYFK
jgi:hypothetical protein